MGTDIYLGKHGSESSRATYSKVIGQWLSNHKLRPASSRTGGRPDSTLIDVHQLFVAYYDFATVYYVKNGKCTGEVTNIEYAIKPLAQLFGYTLVTDFRPSNLKAVRQKMIDEDLCRKSVNSRINRIRRMCFTLCRRWLRCVGGVVQCVKAMLCHRCPSHTLTPSCRTCLPWSRP